MSERTLSVYQFVKNYIETLGRSPSSDEIAQACGLSSRGLVRYHVRKLLDAGLLVRVQRYRGLALP